MCRASLYKIHFLKLAKILIYKNMLLQMSTKFSPLSDILHENKLIGPNYMDWKRNLMIVLQYGKCFRGVLKVHWKQDFPTPPSTSGIPELCVLEVLVSDSGSLASWVVDSGSTNHACNTLQGFRETRRLSRNEVVLSMGTMAVAEAKAIGDVDLHFENGRTLSLRGVYYVPSLRRNLVSVPCLINDKVSVLFDSQGASFRLNGSFITAAKAQSGLLLLNPVSPYKVVSIYNLQSKLSET